MTNRELLDKRLEAIWAEFKSGLINEEERARLAAECVDAYFTTKDKKKKRK